MALAIANRYASALAEVVTQPGSAVSAEDALRQLGDFQELLKTSDELRNILSSPAVTPADKRALTAKLGERLELAVTVCNFLYVVIDHRRMPYLDEMIEAMRAWIDERAGVARIKVTSAKAMGDEQRIALVSKFSRVTGKAVSAEFAVVSELLGGATVRFGSTVFDGSLRAQLNSLDRALSGEA